MRGRGPGRQRPLHCAFSAAPIRAGVFASLLLADMVEQGELALDDPISGHLPSSAAVPTFNGRQIAVADLVTRTSGLPLRVPRYLGLPFGTNSDEGTLDFEDGMTVARLEATVRSRYGDHADRILAAYPHSMDQEASQSAKIISRDISFAWPTWTWARLQSRHDDHKAFVYYFDHRPSGSRQITENGAARGAEIVFVLGTIPTSAGTPPEDLAASDLMRRYWTNFAKSGDPNGEGLPSWPAFDEGDQQVMVFDDDTGTHRVPNLEQLQAIDAYITSRRAQVGQP